MQLSRTARFFSAGALVLGATLASEVSAAAQSQAPPITVCHKTGSATNPWVFMSIDPSTWPEHQAEGDVRANSLAECQQSPATPTAQVAAPTSVPTAVPPTPAPTVAAPPTTQLTVVAQQVAPALPAVSVQQVRGEISQSGDVAQPAQPTPTPPRPRVAPVPTPTTTNGEVSSLPKGGSEPDRTLLVLACLAAGSAGVLMRRVARRAR
jgi:hypothetical protein